MGLQADDIGERVESLLAQLARQGGMAAAGTAEDLVRLLVDFYGSGLTRIVEILGDSPELMTRLTEDKLVESQLILHGLHPVDVDTRIETALDLVRPYLGSHAGGVAYLGIDDEGVAHLRLEGGCSGCPSSSITVRTTIEEAVIGAAP
jgi:Fe-S cluster biogenesis protein NfuA